MQASILRAARCGFGGLAALLLLAFTAPAQGGREQGGREKPQPPPVVKAQDPQDQKLDLNKATVEELQTLPGIGEAYAKKIVANRPYKTLDELLKADLPAATLAKITPLVTIRTKAETAQGDKGDPGTKTDAARTKGQKVDLNQASVEELQELPGIGEAYAKKIVANRPYRSVEDLEKTEIPAATLARITPLVTIRAKDPSPANKGDKSEKSDKGDAGARGEGARKDDPARKDDGARKDKGQKLDLNQASAEELKELPGIGEAYARKIVENRPFRSMDELAELGLPAPTLDKLRTLVTVETAETPARTPPAKGMVWVNTDSKLFHREGSHWYGRTKEGKWMTEAAALAEGFSAAKK